MAKCGMKMPREVAILIAEKGRHSRREVVADPENLGSPSVVPGMPHLIVFPACPTLPSSRYAPDLTTSRFAQLVTRWLSGREPGPRFLRLLAYCLPTACPSQLFLSVIINNSHTGFDRQFASRNRGRGSLGCHLCHIHGPVVRLDEMGGRAFYYVCRL